MREYYGSYRYIIGHGLVMIILVGVTAFSAICSLTNLDCGIPSWIHSILYTLSPLTILIQIFAIARIFSASCPTEREVSSPPSVSADIVY